MASATNPPITGIINTVPVEYKQKTFHYRYNKHNPCGIKQKTYYMYNKHNPCGIKQKTYYMYNKHSPCGIKAENILLQV